MVYDYMSQQGIHSEKNYPYKGINGQCKNSFLFYQKNKNLLKGYVFVRQGIKNLILAAALGPIVVVSYASNLFKSYKKGIYSG